MTNAPLALAARLPPQPPGLPLLGHALEFRRDLLGFLSRAVRDHGDVVDLRLGPDRMLLLARPDLVEEVLVSRPALFRKTRLVRVVGRLVLGGALDATDGEQWRRQVRWSAPAFRSARVAAYATVARDEVERMLDGWQDGEQRRFDVDVLRLMLEVNCRTFCGHALGADSAPVADGISRALDGFAARVASGLPTPDWLPVPANLRMRRGMGAVHRVVRSAIAARRAAGAPGEDLLAMLLAARGEAGRPALDDAQIVDELSVMFALGAHQESLALTWAAFLLARHPHVERRLYAEVDEVLGGRRPTAADLPRLPFTAAVVDETLRLYPPFPLLAREAVADGEIDGYAFRRGTQLGLCPWVTHRDPRYFTEPDAFRPERWLDGLARRLPRFAYFPFGGGLRVCIANASVRDHLTLVLAAIAGRYRLEPLPECGGIPEPVVVLRMRGGLPVVVRKRSEP